MVINNLMALCRECYITIGDRKWFKQILIDKHKKNVRNTKSI